MYYHSEIGTSIAGNVATTITSKDTQENSFLYGQIIVTTDATVANRRLIIAVLDESGNIITDMHAGAVVTASTSNQHHELMQGIFRETTFVGNALQVPVPQDFIIPPGYSFKLSIEGGVAGDSYDYAVAFRVAHVVPEQTVI